MENYFVVTTVEGESFQSVKNTRELAEHWQAEDDCGIGEEIRAWRYNTETKTLEEVNVYEVATEYLNERAEIEEEYRDYCETVNEYGYDYYDNPDNLEMGFDPYMGCYSDDC